MKPPVAGQPVHTRSLTVVLSHREDGAVGLRADVIDLRKTGFVPMSDGIAPAGIVHHMWLEGRVAFGTRELTELRVEQPHVAFEPGPGTGGECCRDPAPRLQALVGRRFDGAFAAELTARFGGALGCSHLLTLFHQVASVLPGALDADAALGDARDARRPDERFFRRTVVVDGHVPEEGLLELAVQLSDFHSAPAAKVRERLGHLLRQDEVRALARLRMARIALDQLLAWERTRTREDFGQAEWRDRSPDLEGFHGRPVMPGLGRALRQQLGGDPDSARLLDALLQLAPGFVQCMPALTDSLMTQLARRGPEGGRAGGTRELPGFLALGGAVDSCYMWRRGGPLGGQRPDHGS